MNLTWTCKTEPGVAIVSRSHWKIPFLNMYSTFERYMDITMGVVINGWFTMTYRFWWITSFVLNFVIFTRLRFALRCPQPPLSLSWGIDIVSVLCIAVCKSFRLRLTTYITNYFTVSWLSHDQNCTINNNIESIYTEKIFIFNTISKVCIRRKSLKTSSIFYPFLEKNGFTLTGSKNWHNLKIRYVKSRVVV